MDSSNKKDDPATKNDKEEEIHVEIKPLIAPKSQISQENGKDANFQRRRSSGIADAARSGRRKKTNSN